MTYLGKISAITMPTPHLSAVPFKISRVGKRVGWEGQESIEEAVAHEEFAVNASMHAQTCNQLVRLGLPHILVLCGCFPQEASTPAFKLAYSKTSRMYNILGRS